jgi:hypothetical protein
MSPSVASRNPTTSREPMAAAIRVITSSRNECSVRSGKDLSQGSTS